MCPLPVPGRMPPASGVGEARSNGNPTDGMGRRRKETGKMRLRHLTIAGTVIVSVLALTLAASSGAAPPPKQKGHTTIKPECALEQAADRAHCDMKVVANLKRVPQAAAAPTAGYRPAD